MKILRVSARLPPCPGGLENHVGELSLTQQAVGHQVHLLFRDGEPPRGLEGQADRLSTPPALRGLPAQPLFGWAAHQWLRKSPVGPEVVHGHGDYAVAAALPTAGTATVLTVHGGLSERPVHRYLTSRAFRAIDQLIAVSADIREQLLARGVSADRVRVISSGIHWDRLAPVDDDRRQLLRQRFGVPPELFLLASVGRLHPVKGFHHLLEAVKALRSTQVLACVILGEGEERRRLEPLMGDFVQLPGAADAETVVSLLQAADAFVLPSVDLGTQREGSPTSILEAMGAGLPVVVTPTGGLPALVSDGENGFVAPSADAGGLILALRRLLAAPHRSRMRQVNRAMMRERDWSAVATRVQEVYELARESARERGARRC